MGTKLRLGLGLIAFLAASSAVKAEVPLVIEEVEYRAERDSSRPDNPKAWQFKAIDPRSRTELWKVELVAAEPKPAVCREIHDPKLSAIGGGLLVEVDETLVFFVDTRARRSEMVLDARARSGKGGWDVHQKPRENALVPIHYGIATGRPLTKEERERFPRADRPFEGGCCVWRAKIALVLVCPDCSQSR